MINAAIDQSVSRRRPLGHADKLVRRRRDYRVENSITGCGNRSPNINLPQRARRWQDEKFICVLEKMIRVENRQLRLTHRRLRTRQLQIFLHPPHANAVATVPTYQERRLP